MSSDMASWTLPGADLARFAECALHCVEQPYPYVGHYLQWSDHDWQRPIDRHPAFGGSFDWHSSVHMHWSMARLRGHLSEGPLKARVEARLAAALSIQAQEVELAYFESRSGKTFERPYGWAWFLMLHAELRRQSRLPAAGHAPWLERGVQATRPLAELLMRRLAEFLPKLTHPQRAGIHSNTAFAMLLVHSACSDDTAGVARELLEVMGRESLRFYGHDRQYPANYEPSGSDFLSGGLVEALWMSRLLGEAFPAWWAEFQPAPHALANWSVPARPSDRTDGQLVHLDGLNLSRAWCLRGLAQALKGSPHDAATPLHDWALAHWQAALPHVTGGDFVATHWLVSYALLAAWGEG